MEARTPFRYDPMPTLASSARPNFGCWEATIWKRPSAETAKRIKSLIKAGKSYTLAVYPGAEHEMTEYELHAKGERVPTRFAPDYFKMMADFIRNGRIGAHYGNADVTRTVGSNQ